MKKLLLTSLIIMCAGSALAQTAGPLPEAHKTNGMPLMQALNERKTTRSFSDQTIDEATLSDILWAAVGVNKDGNKRTIPTALNRQNISVYVLSANGAFLYDAPNHALVKITDADLRQNKDAPITLAYAADKRLLDKDTYSAMHVGSAYQNVGLYAASAGLANVVRGSFDQDALEKGLNLSDSVNILVTQAIGYPAN